MRQRAARLLFWTFLVLYIAALTWPGLTLANRVRPFVLGLPFVFFWIVLWVSLGLVVFFLMDQLESGDRRQIDDPSKSAVADGPGH